MAKQKRSAAGAVDKQLKAAVKALQAQLRAAERSAEKWRERAKDHKSVAAGIKSELGAARRRLEKAEASVSTWKDRAQARVSPASRPVPVAAPPSSPSGPTAATGTAAPDDTWTVAALRAEARSRGMTNYSRKTKAELIKELGG